MDSCFKPDDPDAHESSSSSTSKNDSSNTSKWFGTTTTTSHSPRKTGNREDADGNPVDYQRMLGVCLQLITAVTVVAAISLIVFMSRTNVWKDQEERSKIRSIIVAIIAILFTGFFIVQSANREHSVNWMVGGFGFVDRLGDRVTAAGISACGTLMFITALLFVTLPKAEGFENGELGAFIFGICCVILTVLFGFVAHILFSRTEVEVDSTAFVSA